MSSRRISKLHLPARLLALKLASYGSFESERSDESAGKRSMNGPTMGEGENGSVSDNHIVFLQTQLSVLVKVGLSPFSH